MYPDYRVLQHRWFVRVNNSTRFRLLGALEHYEASNRTALTLTEK